jgi:hypothetical protein
MDGQADTLSDRKTYGRTDRQAKDKMSVRQRARRKQKDTDRQPVRLTVRQTTGRQAGGQTGRWTDGLLQSSPS